MKKKHDRKITGIRTTRSEGREKVSGAGVGASRATRIFGNSVHAAALQVNEKLLEAASKILRVDQDRLEFTGEVKLQYFTKAHRTGTIIDAPMHQVQIDGGVVMALSYATIERLLIDQGKVTTTNFGESKIPLIRDIPQLKTVIQEYPAGSGPYGTMSIGKSPVLVAAAAIANAEHVDVGAHLRFANYIGKDAAGDEQGTGGVMQYWSDGFCPDPLFHYSVTPISPLRWLVFPAN